MSILPKGSNTLVFTWGRMNPPTSGHALLVSKVEEVARSINAKAAVFLSHSEDKDKNPLPYASKIRYGKAAFGKIITKSNSKIIIQVLQEINKKYKNIVLVVGSDRINEFNSLITKYNGKEYHFEFLKVVSAGERDPDADGASGMSASKLRSLVKASNLEAFIQGCPPQMNNAVRIQMYNELRQMMGIKYDQT